MTRELMAGADPGSGGQSSAPLSIAWISSRACEDPGESGQWGPPGELCLPLDDRGLLLADGLFETVLVEGGKPCLLEPHHLRWCQGAALLGMTPPPALQQVQQLAAEAVARSGISTGALRLNWSRGAGGRGLELPPVDQRGRFWLQLTSCTPLFSPVAVIVSPTERRCASSLLSRCKTFAYGSSIQARRQARLAGADDALLPGSDGRLCCGTAANLLLRQGGGWLTPPLGSGCLPGVMRARLLQAGLAVEALLPLNALAGEGAAGVAALLINSLGCRPIRACDGQPLAALDSAEAEALWRAVL